MKKENKKAIMNDSHNNSSIIVMVIHYILVFCLLCAIFFKFKENNGQFIDSIAKITNQLFRYKFTFDLKNIFICLSDYAHIFINYSSIASFIVSGCIGIGSKYKYGYLMENIAKINYRFSYGYILLHIVLLVCSNYFYNISNNTVVCKIISYNFAVCWIIVGIYLAVVFFNCYVSDDLTKKNILKTFEKISKESLKENEQFLLEIVRYVREKYKTAEINNIDFVYDCLSQLQYVSIEEYYKADDEKFNYYTLTRLIYNMQINLFSHILQNENTVDPKSLYYIDYFIEYIKNKNDENFLNRICDALTLLLFYHYKDKTAINILFKMKDDMYRNKILCRYLFTHLVHFKMQIDKYDSARFDNIMKSVKQNFFYRGFNENNHDSSKSLYNYIEENMNKKIKEKENSALEEYKKILLEHLRMGESRTTKLKFVTDKMKILIAQCYNSSDMSDKSNHKIKNCYENIFDELYYVLLVFNKFDETECFKYDY